MERLHQIQDKITSHFENYFELHIPGKRQNFQHIKKFIINQSSRIRKKSLIFRSFYFRGFSISLLRPTLIRFSCSLKDG